MLASPRAPWDRAAELALTSRRDHGTGFVFVKRVVALIAVSFALAMFTGARRAAAQNPDERVYIVAQGDTLSEIAQRLGVPTRALAERNHLEPPYALRVGRRLRLPEGVSPAVLRGLPRRDDLANDRARSIEPRGAIRRDRRSYGRPRHPGTVRLIREANDEELAINLRRLSRATQRRMARFLRFTDGRQHPIHPRLLRLLAIVSDHFGGRTIRVISGYRPFRRGQWTPHSNHNIGNAIDFRIDGVSNRELRDFCRTLPNVGCGFYPRSVFVHMDVRTESAYWVDWSRPGQRPIYGREDRPPPDTHHAASANTQAPEPAAPPGADEGVDDVAADSPQVRDAPPPTENETESEPSGQRSTAP